MAAKSSKVFIGAFVLGALALGASVAIIWGSGKFFSEKEMFVLFFESSIKGLDVGAPVTLKGVKIGAVKDIDIEAAEENGGITFWIPVYIEIDQDKITKLRKSTPGFGIDDKGKEARLKMLVRQGLRGQLRLQSIVTGKLYVALDFFKGKPARFAGRVEGVPEIPTVPTPFEEASDMAFKIFDEIRQLPIKELLVQLTNMITSLNTLLERPDTEETLVNINSVLQDVSKLVRNIDSRLVPLENILTETVKKSGEEIEITLRDVRRTLSIANEAILTFKSGVGEDSVLQAQLLRTLDEISKAARNLRLLADYLERHPEALIKGKSGETLK